jgi:hypothetical protein
MAGDRFFVTVFARDRAALRQLADFDLDLFQATARAGDEGDEPRIEGLLSLEEIGRLVEAGYRVAVEATESSRSRAAEPPLLRRLCNSSRGTFRRSRR